MRTSRQSAGEQPLWGYFFSLWNFIKLKLPCFLLAVLTGHALTINGVVTVAFIRLCVYLLLLLFQDCVSSLNDLTLKRVISSHDRKQIVMKDKQLKSSTCPLPPDNATNMYLLRSF